MSHVWHVSWPEPLTTDPVGHGVHDDWPAPGCTVPEEQNVHCDEPGSAEKEPAWQLEQVATPCELAADENFPAGHWAHDVLPVADE